MEQNGFSAYVSKSIKAIELEDLKNKYCILTLDNGFVYQGIMMTVYDDAVIFMDRKDGKKKFGRDRIFVCYETASAKKRDDKGGQK